MKWTTEKPTEPGWYWIKGYDDSEPRIIFAENRGKFFDGKYWHNPYKAKWAGPISVPEDE